MNQQDTYYRALRDYRKQTSANRDCESACRSFSAASGAGDSMTVKRAVCHVEEDWIEAIEEGLTYIEKALKEERQFIQSNGEVVVIEKVKHVSTESVVHLAQHSNLITREQKEDEIVPDGLFTVERLNEYAVYENRFLYMLLRYLQDFITLRYTNILTLTNRYEGTLEIDRVSSAHGRSLEYKVYLHELNEDDSYLRDHNPCRDVLERINLILKAVLAFLANPIMECCAKVAMIRPPITKTNVLKMNNNFKGAVRLYEYIVAYEGDGYSVERLESTISPFRDELGAGMSEAGLMSAFLMYEYGLGLSRDFKQAYDEEEKRRIQEELAKKQEQLVRLKRRLEKSEIDPAEYILELEKQNKQLERESAKLLPLRDRIHELEETVGTLNKEISQDKKVISALEAEIEDTVRRYEEKITGINEENERRLADLTAAHTRETESLRADCERRLGEQSEAYEARLAEQEEAYKSAEQAHERKVTELSARHAEEIRVMREQAEADAQAYRQQLDDQRKQAAAAAAEMAARIAKEQDHSRELGEQVQAEEQKRLVTEAELLNLRREQGLIGENETFTNEESFDEVEKQYLAFRQFYREQWKACRKDIRRSLLTLDNFRKPKDQTVLGDPSGNNGESGLPAPDADTGAAAETDTDTVQNNGDNHDET